MLKSSRAARIVAGLLVCIAGGSLFAALHTPLPWMMGSMLAMAAAQMTGAHLEVIPGARDVAMMVVGVSRKYGSSFTPSITTGAEVPAGTRTLLPRPALP